MPNDPRSPRFVGAVPAIAALATVLGCRDLTSPSLATPLEAAASIALPDSSDQSVSTSDREALAAAVSDALSRVMPALSSAAEVSQLRAAVEELQRSVDSPGTSLSTSILHAQRALESLAREVETDAGVGVELSALRLVLDRAAEIDPSARVPRRSTARD